MTEVSATHPPPGRYILEGVPQVHFYQGGKRCPEDLSFASAVRACLEYLGDSEYGCKHAATPRPGCITNCTYAHILGISGTAFWLTWRPGFYTDNAEFRLMSDDPEAPIRHTFQALGYEYEYLTPTAEHDEAYLRQRIIHSVCDLRRPVISFGIIGPPECGIITGYDEDGAILVGWNYFQTDPAFNAGLKAEPSGYYRKRDWFQNCAGLVIIGEKHDRPTLGNIYRQAVQWGIQVARTPEVTSNGTLYHNGLAAYTAWAEHLSHDADFPVDNETVLRNHHWIHELAIGLVAEARWYGSQFLVGMTEHVDAGVHRDAIEDIYHAAGYLAGEHELMWKLWDLEGGNGNPEAFRKMAEPAIRQLMISVILEARDKLARAVEHLDRALNRWPNQYRENRNNGNANHQQSSVYSRGDQVSWPEQAQ